MDSRGARGVAGARGSWPNTARTVSKLIARRKGWGVGGDWRKCGWLVLELRRSRRALDSPSDIFQLVIDNPVNIPLGRDLQFSSANNLILLLQRDFLKAGSGGVLRVGGGRAVENVKRNRQ